MLPSGTVQAGPGRTLLTLGWNWPAGPSPRRFAMTQFLPKTLFLLSASALVLCTMIAAGTAQAKDTDKSSDTAAATLKNRQIVVEPAAAPSNAKPTETSENAP